ncbi:MAG TPA: type IV toxin-antitoxin system AbiEi family antitoxin domain-containing protein [Acidimicrobiales bacterium]|nr:type IV toxin-antitoxin system AbiEi family antitoxin domain-containing protein [Acidimicrobiales bacterium]
MTSALDRLARRQHGLVTRRQALDSGFSATAVKRRVALGTWLPLAAGVYALASSPPTWQRQVLAACLAVGGIASHRTAAALWGLSGFRPGPVHVLVAHGRSSCAAPATIHQSRTLRPAEVTRVDGIPVTRVARTLADLARHVARPALEDAVDDALCRRLVPLDSLARQRASPGFNAVLATWHDGSAPHEVAEARLLRRVLHAGLPPPETQHEVWHAGRFVARLDLAWPDRRLAVELDGFRWHASPRAFQRDRARRNVLVHLDWTVYQATPADLVGDGARVADLLRPHLTEEEVRRPA